MKMGRNHRKRKISPQIMKKMRMKKTTARMRRKRIPIKKGKKMARNLKMRMKKTTAKMRIKIIPRKKVRMTRT